MLSFISLMYIFLWIKVVEMHSIKCTLNACMCEILYVDTVLTLKEGQNSIGNVMKNLYKLTGIKQTTMTPYHGK